MTRFAVMGMPASGLIGCPSESAGYSSPVTGRRGIVLVLVSGLLTVTAFLAVLFLRTSGILEASGKAERTRKFASIAAESGMSYAASRLWEDPSRPDVSAREPRTAGDDWSWRGGGADELLPGAPNPSYARGDRWSDEPAHQADGLDNDGDSLVDEPHEGKGDYAIGDALAADLNGDGFFDAVSGRLRGPSASASARFSLRIDSLTARICVNGGELGAPLGDHDLDGILNRDDPDFADDRDGNGVPDWRDPDFRGNAHLVNLLGNLGAVVGLPVVLEPFAPGDPSAVPPIPATPGLGDVETSALGRRLVQNRPCGGYRSMDEVRKALGTSAFARVSRFLTVAGEIVPIAFAAETAPDACVSNKRWAYDTLLQPGGNGWSPEPWYEFHGRIDFNEAPIEILKASLRYVTASGTYLPTPKNAAVRTESPFVRLLPGEADRIAGRLAERRPIHTWQGLLRAIVDHVPDADFEDDPFVASYDPAKEGPKRRRLKEDLILAQFDANGYFLDPYSWGRNTLEIDREPAQEGCDPTRVRQIEKWALSGPLNTAPYRADGGLAANESELAGFIPSRMTTEFSLASPAGVFQAASVGWLPDGPKGAEALSRVEASIDMGGRQILLTSQQDFERLPRSLAFPGMDDRWDHAGGEVFTDAPAPGHFDVSSFPRFSLRAYQPDGVEPGNPEARRHHQYPRGPGDLRLAADPLDAGTLQGETVFAIPFNEDVELGDPATRYSSIQCRENLADPVRRPPVNTPDLLSVSSDGLDFPEEFENFHRGLALSPFGFRRSFTTPIPDLVTRAFSGASAQPGRVERRREPLLIPFGPFGGRAPGLASGRFLWLPLGVRPPGGIGGDPGGDPGGGGSDPVPAGAWRLGGSDSAFLGSLLGLGWRNGKLLPLPRDDYISSDGVSHPGRGPFIEGAVSAWLPCQGGENPRPGYFVSEFGIYVGDHGNYLRAILMPDGAEVRLGLWTQKMGYAGETRCASGVWQADIVPLAYFAKPWSGGGWVHIALRFAPPAAGGNNKADVDVFIDGDQVGTFPLDMGTTGGAPDEEAYIDVYGPLDDLLILPGAVADGRIRALAQRNRHPVQGIYTSPRFHFDPSRLPAGAVIQGIAWDGFIPGRSGGRLVFDLQGYDAGGAPIAAGEGRNMAWSEGKKQGRSCRIRACRSVEVQVTIEADDPSAWPDIGASRALRDTPILDEVRISYSAAGPGWSEYQTR